MLKGGKAHKGGRRSLAALVIEPDKIKSGRLRRVWRDGHSPPAPGEAFHHRSQGEKKKIINLLKYAGLQAISRLGGINERRAVTVRWENSLGHAGLRKLVWPVTFFPFASSTNTNTVGFNAKLKTGQKKKRK